jgi:hypothetical protein
MSHTNLHSDDPANADHSGRASKASNVFVYSKTGTMGSNPTQGMDVCNVSVYSLLVLSSGLATG